MNWILAALETLSENTEDIFTASLLCEIADRLSKMPRWTKPSEETPSTVDDVLVAFNDESPFMGYYMNGEWFDLDYCPIETPDWWKSIDFPEDGR